MDRLRERVALVTGGSNGIGRAIAARLAAEGALVVVGDIAQPSSPCADPARDHFMPLDVTDESQWTATVARIEEEFGRLDILVNNAGVLGAKRFARIDEADLGDWRHVFAVNVEGVLMGCRAAIPLMARGGRGSIVNIASVAGRLATPYASAYGASKAAVTQLSKTVAQHCAELGFPIRCNSVHPGNVRTPLLDHAMAETARIEGRSLEAVRADRAADQPLGDFTLVEDVAAAVAFLASDDARHVTGSQLIVDGGILGCDTYHLAPPPNREAAA